MVAPVQRRPMSSLARWNRPHSSGRAPFRSPGPCRRATARGRRIAAFILTLCSYIKYSYFSIVSIHRPQGASVMSIRPVKRIVSATPHTEGAGVKLRRAFGFGETSEFDPFLLLDDFRNENPNDYLAGFPWHPHRGIETITYVLAGNVEHGDSLGNRGSLGAGDVQWMTAGSGIMHQEMPQGDAQGRMHGFQLWANLPANLKMTAPRYQDIASQDIPEVVDDDGTRVRVIVGDFWGKQGPVEGVAAD